MRLQLSLSPHVLASDGRALPLAARDAALLAWLALEGPTPRARLAALLWPGSEPDAARNALRQRLFQLKRQCAAELVVGSTLLALAPGLAHDLDDADGVLGEQVHDHSPEFAAWLGQQRERLRRRLRQSLVELADMAERARDHADALSHAGELLALEPLSEDAHRRLMRLHYLAGDRAAALLAFDRCERLLKDEVGTRPSSDTLALLAAIEQSQPLAGRVVAVPPATLRPPRLVGRDRELQAARTAWQRGQVLSLSGEAGLGKTRLLQELAATSPGAVLAQARPGDSVVPFAAFGRLLRAVAARAPDCLRQAPALELARLLPEIHAPYAAPYATPLATLPVMAGATQQRALQRAVVAVLAAAAAQGVDTLLFDDLHFADDASLDLLQAVLRPDDDATLPRVALAQRPGEGSPSLLALHDALTEDQALSEVRLQLLDASQLHELVDSLGLEGVDAAALGRQLFRLTGGNPLFALETLRQGHVESRLAGDTLPRPTSVARLIERRLQRLSAPALRLARCAAVAGQDFDASLASHVLRVQALDLADAWVELEVAQVLRDGGFAHDLIHDAVRASVPVPLARPLHADIAGYLAARGKAAGRVAQHWAQAERWAEAGAAYVAAAQAARDAARRIEQAALLAEAAACHERAGDAPARFEALLQRADVLGRVELAGQALASLAGVDAAARDEEQRLRVLQVRVQTANRRGEVHRTLELAQQGLDTARALGRKDLALGFAISLSNALAELRRAGEGVALLEPLRDWVEAEGSDEQRWCWTVALGLALDYANRLVDAVAAWQAALALAQRMRRIDLIWQATQDLGSTHAKMGQIRLAVTLSLQARQLARASDEDAQGHALQSQVTLAHRLRDVGRYAEALPLFEEALAFFRRADASAHSAASVEHRLAQTFQQLGQTARMQSLLAAELPAALSPSLHLMRCLHRADLARLLGGDALTPVREAMALIPDRHDIYHRLASLFASAVLPPDEGENLATGLAAWASAHQRHGLALAGHVRAAGCALAQGAAPRARSHVEAALHLADGYEPDSFYLPELWLVAVRVFDALGATAEAEAALQRGVDWARRVHDLHVPDEFKHSFLHRNPVNRDLLARAGRHAPATL